METKRFSPSMALTLTFMLILSLFYAIPRLALSEAAATPDAAIVSLTAEELAAYNGQDGMPAYVAVDGRVYDVTDNPAWQGGEHQGQYAAGQDLSDAIKAAPHGEAVLADLPLVAYLLDPEAMDIPAETMTPAALAAFTGKDGSPAYVAVDGIVYDVSASAMWPSGEHQGQYEAGQDFSALIREVSPHGISVLERLPVVARLVAEPQRLALPALTR